MDKDEEEYAMAEFHREQGNDSWWLTMGKAVGGDWTVPLPPGVEPDEFVDEVLAALPQAEREVMIRAAAKEAGLALLSRQQSEALDAYRRAVVRHPMDTRDELRRLYSEVDPHARLVPSLLDEIERLMTESARLKSILLRCRSALSFASYAGTSCSGGATVNSFSVQTNYNPLLDEIDAALGGSGGAQGKEAAPC
jgi:hypothetical protein